MWIRAVGVFPAIIEPGAVRCRADLLAIRNRHLSNDEMLTLLNELYLRLASSPLVAG